MDYPIAYGDQMRHHLRSLRKARGLTQKMLAQRMGLSQGRIAEIEADPKRISVEQLLQILSVLRVRLVLREMEMLSDQKTTAAGLLINEGQW